MNLQNENENENENLTLETFFDLLHPEKKLNIEHYDDNTSVQIISNINDAIMNNGLNELENSKKQIISKNNSIYELQQNTSLIYNYIYSIFLFIFVIILLGIITYLKVKMSQNMYQILIIFVILSYIFYVMYLFNIMYVKDGISKIIHLIRYGRFESEKVILNKLPQSLYMKELCKKKKSLEIAEEDDIYSLMKKGTYKPPIPNTKNNAYVYNDNNAPNLQLYPEPKGDKFKINYVDSDEQSKEFVKTMRL